MASDQWSPWVWVKWKAGCPNGVWDKWKDHPQVVGAWSTQGDWDCVFHLNVANPSDLETFVWESLRTHEWVKDTWSSWSKKWW